MRIASWNVNSVKARLPNVLEWIVAARPDVVLLQELKCQTADFPAESFTRIGYRAAVKGQKAYNGVAILSTHPIEDVVDTLPGDPADEQARWIEATISGIRVASAYVPNGNPAPGEKFDYKLGWMERLAGRARDLFDSEKPVVLGGDYNVCPADADVYDPKGWKDDALCRPESRARFRRLLTMGYIEVYRALNPDEKRAWTFWDYQQAAWQRDAGLRIDHFLVSPEAADRIETCRIDKGPRGKDKASDHTPIVLDLA